MTQPGARRLFRKRRVRSYVTRGSVYCWLRAYYTEVAAALAREEHSWAVLVADMAIDCVRGRGGGELTANAALRVWQRVQRDVEAEAEVAKAAPIGGKYPSRISPDWRPEVVPSASLPPPSIQVPPPASVPGPAGPSSALAVQDGGSDLSRFDEVGRARIKAMEESVLAQLFEMDRKKFGQ